MIPDGLVSLCNGALYVPASFDLEGWEWADGYVIDEKNEDSRTWEIILHPADPHQGRSRVKLIQRGSHNLSIASWFGKNERPPGGYYPAQLVDGCLCIDIEAGLENECGARPRRGVRAFESALRSIPKGSGINDRVSPEVKTKIDPRIRASRRRQSPRK